MQQQLAAKTDEATRLDNDLHDAGILIGQHIIAESARAGMSNPPLHVPVQTQHHYTSKPETATEEDHPQPDLFKEPAIPTAKKTKKAPARKAALTQEINSQIQGDMQWIFMLDREQWHEHLPSGWTTSASLHPAMSALLNSTSLPLWAAFPPLSKEWAII